MKLEFKCKKCNQHFVISGDDLDEVVLKAIEAGILDEKDDAESVGSAGIRHRHYQDKHQKPPKKPEKKRMPVTEL